MITITLGAAVRRINRKLAHDCKQLRTCQWNSRSFNTLGRYYLVDCQINYIIEGDIDPEEFGRDIGVIAEYERIEEAA